MVFSFFSKKPAEKMVAKPSVKPCAKDRREVAETPPGQAVEKAPAPPSPEAIQAAAAELSDFEFSDNALGFQVEDVLDPVDATAEEVAMLFASAQDHVVRQVLTDALREFRSGKAERLWLMLFDLYRLHGEQAVFESLGIEFAGCFEKSPPSWRNKSAAKSPPAEAAVSSLLFPGNLTGDNLAAIDAIATALGKQPRLRLDLSKVCRLDDAGCGRLLAQLQKAGKLRQNLEVLGRDVLATLAHEQMHVGQASNRQCWLLFLELCQLQGQHELFEEVALDYAVSFEISPPSWENSRVAAPEPEPVALPPAAQVPTDAYVLRGSIKGERFVDLPAFAQGRDALLIECSGLARMDFVSAGALLNVLTTIRQAGKPIIFQHPNHLVAELFSIVGITAVANVIFAKY